MAIMEMKEAITCMLSLLLQLKVRIFINSYDCVLINNKSEWLT